MNKLMLLVQFLCVYLYCRRVFYFGPHNISSLYEVGLHIYHCRMEFGDSYLHRCPNVFRTARSCLYWLTLDNWM